MDFGFERRNDDENLRWLTDDLDPPCPARKLLVRVIWRNWVCEEVEESERRWMLRLSGKGKRLFVDRWR